MKLLSFGNISSCYVGTVDCGRLGCDAVGLILQVVVKVSEKSMHFIFRPLPHGPHHTTPLQASRDTMTCIQVFTRSTTAASITYHSSGAEWRGKRP